MADSIFSASGLIFSNLPRGLTDPTPNPPNMDLFWTILGVILAIVAIAGSILPLLPGPPVAYLGLLLQQLKSAPPFTPKFLVIWAIIVIITLVLDYLIPIWGTKKFGGSKYGIWGCTIGFVAAFWMGPMGVILGPLLGAFIGEMLAGKTSRQSFRAAMGSLAGFLFGSFLKLLVCFFMLYYIIVGP